MGIKNKYIRAKILPNTINENEKGNKESNNNKIYKSNKELYNGYKSDYNSSDDSLSTDRTLNILIYSKI